MPPHLRIWITKVKLEALYQELRSSLSESDARYVLKKRLNLTVADFITQRHKELEADEVQSVLDDLAAVQGAKPLSRIYGENEFWGMNFILSDETLDPRQDTEALIECVLKRYAEVGKTPERILDLGTGSGAILIALLKEFPDATGVGGDLSEGAIKTARINAEKNEVAERAEFIQGSWAENIEERFDLIVSNPPYIRSDVITNLDENVKKHDPILALDGGEDGLQAYKAIFLQIPELVKPGSYAFFEIGFDQEESLMRLSEESRFLLQGVHRDSAGNPRVVEIFFE